MCSFWKALESRISNMTFLGFKFILHKHANTQMRTYKNTTCSKNLTCAIFFKSMRFKYIKYDITVVHSSGPVTFNWSSHSTGPPIQLVPKYMRICWRSVSGSCGRHFWKQKGRYFMPGCHRSSCQVITAYNVVCQLNFLPRFSPRIESGGKIAHFTGNRARPRHWLSCCWATNTFENPHKYI